MPAAGGTISLSNLIKSTYYITSEEIKLIEVAPSTQFVHMEGELREDEPSLEISEEDQQLLAKKDDIIREAELIAKAQIQQSLDEIAQLKEQAAAEIEHWWNEEDNRMKSSSCLHRKTGLIKVTRKV